VKTRCDQENIRQAEACVNSGLRLPNSPLHYNPRRHRARRDAARVSGYCGQALHEEKELLERVIEQLSI
jgi:hypothetical protein